MVNHKNRKKMREFRQAKPAEQQTVLPTAEQPSVKRLDSVWTAFQETQRMVKKVIPSVYWSRLRKSDDGSVPKHPESINVPTLSVDMEQEMVELYQGLRTVIANNGTIIEFIGSVKGEGTSTIAWEFSRVAAVKFHRKVLLFNADWRAPAPYQQSLNGNQKSIEAVARNSIALDQAIQRVDDGPLFQCRICTDHDLSPDLYDLPAMADVWSELRRSFDLVVIDSPPATASSDGVTISREVDGVVLVMRAETTRWPVSVAVKEKIVKNGGKIVGFAFNDRRFYIPRWIYRRL